MSFSCVVYIRPFPTSATLHPPQTTTIALLAREVFCEVDKYQICPSFEFIPRVVDGADGG